MPSWPDYGREGVDGAFGEELYDIVASMRYVCVCVRVCMCVRVCVCVHLECEFTPAWLDEGE